MFVICDSNSLKNVAANRFFLSIINTFLGGLRIVPIIQKFQKIFKAVFRRILPLKWFW